MDSTTTLITAVNHSQYPTEQDYASSGSDAMVNDDEQTISAVAKDESAYGENDVAKDEQTNAIANQEITSGEVAAEKGEEAAVMIDDSTGVDSDVTKDSSNAITYGDHSALLSVSVNCSGGLTDGNAHSQQPDHGFDINLQDVSKELLEMKAKEEAEIGSTGDNKILLEDISEQWELKAEKEKQSQAIDVQLVMNSIGLTETDLSELNAGEAWEVKLNDGKREEERRNQVAMEALGFTSKELDRMKGEEAWETKIDPEEIKALHVDNDSVGTKKSRCVIS